MRWNGDDGRRLRLLVGDRQTLVAEALAAMLTQSGYEISARVGSGAQAAAAIAGGGIDMALLDIGLADPSPTTLLAQPWGEDRPAFILIASGPDDAGLSAALGARPDGLVLKSQGAAALHHCIGTVVGGGRCIDPAALLPQGKTAERGLLTRRERDVARLVATGERNRSIGDRLGISEGTVKMHLHNVYNKLGIETRTQLAMDERVRACC